MTVRSPLGMIQSTRALAERPWRHRRHDELRQGYSAPADAWWSDDDRWFPSDTPPRHGNRLTPLVDGQRAMRAMYEAMENARESIYVTAWFLTPHLRMIRPADDPSDPRDGKGGPHAFVSLAARKAADVDVRVLLWPGALLGKFARRHVKATQRTLLQAHPRLRVRLDTHERPGHCQHQKTLVVDGRVAFVGGLDVTAFDADRWDEQEHAFREGRNWHDVDWKIEGPCVSDVYANFAQRWNAVAPHDPVRHVDAAGVSGDPRPDGVVAQVQRTIPRGVYSFARGGYFGIAHAYCRAIARAERFIYLESQYLWSPEITDALCDAIRRGRESGLQIALVLPSHPNVGKGDTDRHVEQLLRADARAGANGAEGVFRAYTLYTSWWDREERRFQYRPVYVHAKVAVIDDSWVTVGSANLNGRGLATDAEMNVSSSDPATARDLRLRLWAEHSGRSEDELRHIDPVLWLRQQARAVASEQHGIVRARSGLLTAALYPYTTGHVSADFGPGEVESALLDR